MKTGRVLQRIASIYAQRIKFKVRFTKLKILVSSLFVLHIEIPFARDTKLERSLDVTYTVFLFLL